MSGGGAGADESAAFAGDEFVAELADRLSAGESLDLDALALEFPDGVERVRRLLPALAVVARLRASPDARPFETPVQSLRRTGVEPGTFLGDFRTVRVIGRGGMGIVYDAIQVSLNRRVALKILPACSSGDPRKLKRFQIEAQAAACLLHPHIVPVYLVGSEGDVHYYAMQFIEGQNLAELIAASRRQGEAEPARTSRASGDRPSPRVAALLGQQAAEALHFAHEQGVLHRDVKPSNLLVADSGWLWVGDFGLARVSGSGDLTDTGATMGTLRYMSPEQALGPRAVVDHRTDIYALGATLYELITLRPAFDGDDRLELLRRIAQDEPRRPRRIDPAIPRDLETIVLQAMAKDPAQRYTTALALADDLGRFLQGQPILARPPGAIHRAQKWMQRHKTAVAAASVGLLVAVMASIGASFWRNGVLSRHNSKLRSALELAERHESAARRLWYDSQMRLAQQAWASGQIELAQEILEGLRPESAGRELRGFEWNYLWRVCHHDFSVLAEHEPLSMIVSPDGRTLVSGDGYGSLLFWDLAAGRERKRIQSHPRVVSGLMFSPNGETLATWSTAEGAPSEAKLWDPSTGRQLATIAGFRGRVVGLAFSPDGRTLAVSEHDKNGDAAQNRAVFWSLERGPENPAPGAAPFVCDKLVYSPDGRWLATSGSSGNVTLRDATTGDSRASLPKAYRSISAMAVSNDGATLAVADQTRVSFWDIATLREVGSVPIPSMVSLAFSADGDRLAGVTATGESIKLIADIRTNPREFPLEKASGKELQTAFSPDGKTLAGGGSGLSPTIWDASSGRKLARFSGKTGSAGRLVFAPGGESLIFSSEDGRIRSWHFVEKPEPIAELAGHKAEVWGLAYTPDGTTLISSADDHSIKLWDTRHGELLRALEGHNELVASLAISADGRLLASAGFDKTVRLWDLPSGNPRAVLRGHTDRVRAVAFSSDGRRLASAGSDKTVRLWDVTGGESLLAFTGHTDTVRALAFDQSGTLLLSSSDDRTIRGIGVKSGRESLSLLCSQHNSALAFSADGSLLASGDDRGNLSIWDVPTWSRRRLLKGSDAGIWGLAFSPDGKTLAAACGDAKVRLWDPTTGQVMLVLDGHSQRVNAVAFAPDGATLASAGHDGAIRLWRAATP
jgi:WD40 repeat protein/serine/threonine protein kinase